MGSRAFARYSGAMSEKNVENFKRGADAWNRDDFDAWIDQFDPEVEWFALMEVFAGTREPGRLGRASRATCNSQFDLTTSGISGNPSSHLGSSRPSAYDRVER